MQSKPSQAATLGARTHADGRSKGLPDLIGRVTDAVLDEALQWQNRPLDPVCSVFFDAVRVKIRGEGLVKNKTVYVALALNPDGGKEVLGPRIEQTKFWLKIVNELKAHGVNNILIAVVDDLKGFPEAIVSVCPQTVVRTCIVHLIRNGLAFVSAKDRKAIPPAIRTVFKLEPLDCCGGRRRPDCPSRTPGARSVRPGRQTGPTELRLRCLRTPEAILAPRTRSNMAGVDISPRLCQMIMSL